MHLNILNLLGRWRVDVDYVDVDVLDRFYSIGLEVSVSSD